MTQVIEKQMDFILLLPVLSKKHAKSLEFQGVMQFFENADVRHIPSLLSDHPANGDRITTLERHMRENPSVFAKFNSDPQSATPLSVPKDAPEQFLR